MFSRLMFKGKWKLNSSFFSYSLYLKTNRIIVVPIGTENWLFYTPLGFGIHFQTMFFQMK